jgi:hypothetical protein
MTARVFTNRQEGEMRRRSSKIILTTVAVTGVLGASVAVAADSPVCPYGNTPKATQKAPARSGDRTQLRKRDGTGPRHAQRAPNRGSGRGQWQGQGQGNRGADCPYRS